jgi:DNA-binding CsgD family transcriptional regulator
VNQASHGKHAACCLTPAFCTLMGAAETAVLVVDALGFVIYANQTGHTLLGYGIGGLTGCHIFDLADAEPVWVASEFEKLKVSQVWSGRVLLRRGEGGSLRVAVNAYSNPLPDGSAEYVALLHPTLQDGPAIVRLPGAALYPDLTVREVALLQLIAEGFSDKEIAVVLRISVWSINKCVGSLLRKLNATSRTAVCIAAVKAGIIV